MRRTLTISLLVAIVIWLLFSAVLLGYKPVWLPAPFAALAIPESLADFGQAFSALDGLISSMALMLGLCAVLIQVRQNADANRLNALTARQHFMLTEYKRLDRQIDEYIKENSGKSSYDDKLVKNMSTKKNRMLDQSTQIDEIIEKLLKRI